MNKPKAKLVKKPVAKTKPHVGRTVAVKSTRKPTVAPKKEVVAPSKRSVKLKPTAKMRTVPKAKVAVKSKVTLPKPSVKPKVAKPPKLDLNEFRERLLEEQTRLQEQLTEIEQRTARMVDSETPSELSGYEDHPADLASETFEREKDLALEENLQDMLNKVKAALEKIAAGTYGICDACGQGINKYRMEVQPFATLCFDCQSKLEAQ